VQLGTFIKLGSLAFGVAQDDRVRELATMIHKGAKRRGALAPWAGPTQALPSAQTSPGTTGTEGNPNAHAQTTGPHPSSPPIPFAPSKPVPFSPATHSGAGVPYPVNKYLTVDNAKKVLSVAGQVANMLIK